MNLRMLCISMLLLLALVPVTAKPLTDSTKDRVIAEVERLGGKVELDETLPAKPIVKIDLHSTQVTDADLAFLSHAKKDLRELRYLDLRLTHIGDAGAANLKNLTSLQTLNLFRTQVGDKGLAYLKNLRQLQTLLISGTKITDEGAKELQRSLPRLRFSENT